MSHFVFTHTVDYKVASFHSYRNTRISVQLPLCLPSDKNGSSLPSSKLGRFCYFSVGKSKMIAFESRNAVKGESYTMEIFDFEGKTAISSGHSPICCITSLPDAWYRIQCTVFVPSAEPPAPPQQPMPRLPDKVLPLLSSYCKDNSEYCMTFECQGLQIKAVTALMACRSPVIGAMMNSDCIEARTKNVKIVDFSPEVVQKLVEFCETNTVQETDDLEMELCQIATKYQIDDMLQLTTSLLVLTVNKSNIVKMFQFAKIYDNSVLEKRCLKFAKDNLTSVADAAKGDEIDSAVLKQFWKSVILSI